MEPETIVPAAGEATKDESRLKMARFEAAGMEMFGTTRGKAPPNKLVHTSTIVGE